MNILKRNSHSLSAILQGYRLNFRSDKWTYKSHNISGKCSVLLIKFVYFKACDAIHDHTLILYSFLIHPNSIEIRKLFGEHRLRIKDHVKSVM